MTEDERKLINFIKKSMKIMNLRNKKNKLQEKIDIIHNQLYNLENEMDEIMSF